MTIPEQMFTARQAAKRLGLSLAMTRRYGAALEAITQQAIRQDPRDGRLFRQDQLEAMLRAKAFIERDPRLSVAVALRRALGDAQGDATQEVAQTAGDGSVTLSEVHVRALLGELRALREEVAGMRSELRERDEARALPPAVLEPTATSIEERVAQADDETFYGYRIRDKDHHPEPNDGMLVRLARRLEQLLGRGRS